MRNTPKQVGKVMSRNMTNEIDSFGFEMELEI
jgi:hypothetical protein